MDDWERHFFEKSRRRFEKERRERRMRSARTLMGAAFAALAIAGAIAAFVMLS